MRGQLFQDGVTHLPVLLYAAKSFCKKKIVYFRDLFDILK